MMQARDEHGGIDDHCVNCGHRIAPVYTAKQLDEMAVYAVSSKRINGHRRNLNISTAGFDGAPAV